MKATHIMWENMWEKYYSDYPGWASVINSKNSECIKEVEDNFDGIKEQGNCCFLSNSDETTPYNNTSQSINTLDKLYPVEKDKYSKRGGDETDNFLFISELRDYTDEAQRKKECLTSTCQADVPFNDTNDNLSETDQIKACENEKIVDKTYHDNDANYRNGDGQEYQINSLNSSNITDSFDDPENGSYIRCKPFGKQPDDIIFECGTGQGFAFVTHHEEALTYAPHKACISKTLGTIAIDTTCLKSPKTKVLFSCNINFTPRSFEATSQLEFVLSRSCNNSEESLIGNWVYDIIDRNEREAQLFRFTFCNCNSFPGCYNYYIRVLPVYIKHCCVCITNCNMDAFAQSR